jgi:hypothetical protein
MIVEQRTYTLAIGRSSEYLAVYEAEGLAIQQPMLGRLFGYFTTETGELNQIVHMWAYADMAERAERRTRLFADGAWLAFVPKLRPYIVRQESQILIPAPFSPPLRPYVDLG